MRSETKKLTLIIWFSLIFSIYQILQTLIIEYKLKKFGLTTLTLLISGGLTGLAISISSYIILLIRHPYMVKMHGFRYGLSIMVIVYIFQFLIFIILKNKYLSKEKVMVNPKEKTILIFDNKHSFKFKQNDVLFIKADGNYSEIYELKEKHLVRSTLKQILENNKDTSLIRVHKSYIVNRDKIKSISGNTKGYKLYLYNYDHSLPVSMDIGEKLKQKISI